MKIAIGICEKINGICTTMGCFKALNGREKSFSIYREKNLELISFFTCNACSNNSYENLIGIAQKLEEGAVKTLHLGVCIVRCEAGRTKEIKEIFENASIKVIEGTH